MAVRVMNAANPGDLLMSSTAAEFATAYEGWKEKLVGPGSIATKHERELTVFAMVGPYAQGRFTDPRATRSEFFDQAVVTVSTSSMMANSGRAIQLRADRQNRILIILVSVQTIALLVMISLLAAHEIRDSDKHIPQSNDGAFQRIRRWPH